MAKHKKTLKEKKKSQLRLQHDISSSSDEETKIHNSYVYSGQAQAQALYKTTKKNTSHLDEDSLLIVDPKYIKADLLKTLYLTLLILVVIIGLYWYFQLGGESALHLLK
jgi:hypothetical protein